jgi:hypothetical protein
MREKITSFLLVAACFSLNANVAYSTEEPEFDGCYIRLKNGKYIEWKSLPTPRMGVSIALDNTVVAWRFAGSHTYADNLGNDKPKFTTIAQKDFDSMVCRGDSFKWKSSRGEGWVNRALAVYHNPQSSTENKLHGKNKYVETTTYLTGYGDIQYWLYTVENDIPYKTKEFGNSMMYKPTNELKKGIYEICYQYQCEIK